MQDILDLISEASIQRQTDVIKNYKWLIYMQLKKNGTMKVFIIYVIAVVIFNTMF